MSRIMIEDLFFQYGSRGAGQAKPVLDHISFSIEENQSVGIIGANGVGKSTLLKILVGLLPAYQGNVRVDGMMVTDKNLPEIRQKMGYVFQDSDSQLFMNTVYEDVAFGPRNYGLAEDEVEKRVQSAMEQTHTAELASRHIYKLSGGQKKLVSIATILSLGSEIILMDEPSVALDPGNRENLIRILQELGGVQVIASHDLDFIYDTCERTVLLANGGIIYDGDTKKILKNKKMLEEHGLRLPLSFRFGWEK